MSGKSFFKNSALGALAAAMIASALPATAFAQDRQERGARSWGSDRGGSQRSDGQRGGGDYRAQAQARAQVRTQQAPQPRVVQPGQPARVERPATQAWQGRGNAGNAPRWGTQDRTTTERPARDWQRGTVNRPQQAQGAATPRTPERGWDGNRWNGSGQTRTENRDVNRDRNWRDNDRDRGSSWNGRNPSYSDRDRNRDYRSGDNWRRDNDRRDNWRGNDRNDNRRWSSDWRRDNRYNWSSYRNSNRNHYRMPRYYAPYRNYNYSRLSIGFFLNSGFYGNNYWINDPWSYRLPPAYAGYRWVRYYDDVLLVDTYSGEVVDVIYDFFW